MDQNINTLEAQAALDAVHRGRRRVVDEIGLPRWYWAGLAVGWIGVGLITDLGHAWATAVATLIFGAVHAAVVPHVMSGRHRSRSLSVRVDVAPANTPRFVLGGLVLLTLLTIAGALAASADGARHPATAASIPVAVLIVLGGPQLLAALRRAAARTAEAR